MFSNLFKKKWTLEKLAKRLNQELGSVIIAVNQTSIAITTENYEPIALIKLSTPYEALIYLNVDLPDEISLIFSRIVSGLLDVELIPAAISLTKDEPASNTLH